MFKKTLSKYVGLTLVAVLVLSACNKQTGPTEEPSVVLEKSITQGAKIYETNTDFKVTFSDPETKASGDINVIVKDKTNSSDLENLQSESAMEITADLKIPEPNYSFDAEASEAPKPEVGQILVDAAGNFKISGDDIYASLTKLELDGDFEGLEEVKAMLPIFVGPYMNETVYLPLSKLEPIMAQANAELEQEGQPTMNFDELKAYGANQLPKDLADSKMLIVSKDHGVETVKTLAGESVSAYHYEIDFDAKGFETFLKKYNENMKLIPEAELTEMFTPKEGEPGVAEIVEVINQALDFQMWIGQEDYHTYKAEMTVDMESLNAAIEKIQEISVKLGQEAPFTEADMKFFKEGKLDISVAVQSAPLDSFTVEKPADEGLIDLGPMFEMATQGVMNQVPVEAPTEAMTEEEMQQMLEELAVPSAETNATAPPVTE